MNTSFTEFDVKLQEYVQKEEISLINFAYFLKGDISGIQDFIFDVKSERAARVLKGRSFFIQAISKLAVELIKSKTGAVNVKTLYNGGGNFYMLLKEEAIVHLEEVKEIIETDCRDEAIYLSLAWVPLGIGEDFGDMWDNLHKESNRNKLRKYSDYSLAFDPFDYEQYADWVDFTREFIKSKGYDTNLSNPSKKPKKVFEAGISFFNYDYFLTDENEKFKAKVINRLPLWTKALLDYYKKAIEKENDRREVDEKYNKPKKGRIIEFEWLARFAKGRTGTDKLGILKMDIDNLGLLFKKNREIKQAQKISIALKWFFEEFINTLLDQPYDNPQTKEDSTFQDTFGNNIYVVFSGGDDCFMLGAWDAIFEFALRLRKEFEAFVSFLKAEVPNLPERITLSAGLLVVDSKFPVVRFAKMADEAIDEAKKRKDEKGCIVKNSISVFGQVLSWTEFEEAKNTGAILTHLIKEKGEPRAILERIKRSAIGFEKAQNRAVKGEKAAIWRLYYYLRNVKNVKEMDQIIQQYTKALIAAFNQKERTNPMVFPVAARWAEFLTRNASKSK